MFTVIFGLEELNQELALGNPDLRIVAGRLIQIALNFSGIILVFVILWSGAQLLFSGGKDENISRARKTFFSGIIGIIIVFLAYSIVRFVITSITGALGE